MLENEVKFSLTKNDHEKIKLLYFNNKKHEKKLQINYYYDNDNNDLFNNNITLRIRQIENTLTLEAKYPLKNVGVIKRKEERSIILHSLPTKINLNDSSIKEHIGDLSRFGTIKILGSLVTERLSIKPLHWIQVDLDYNMYLGKSDYELEIEILNGYENEAEEFLKPFLYSYSLSKHGKNKRFRDNLLNHLD